MLKLIYRTLILFTVISLNYGALAYEVLDAKMVVPELLSLNIKELQVIKYVDPRFLDLSENEDKYFLVIKLGKLNKSQYQKIHKLYGGLSKVPYKKNKSYELSDFLPPSIQAVINKVFNPISYNTDFLYEPKYEELSMNLQEIEEDEAMDAVMDLHSLSKGGLGTTTNCWNTTIENLNSILGDTRHYNLFLPSRWNADELMKDTLTSKSVSNKKLLNWDVLTINEKSEFSPDISMLMHTALIVGEKLVFEKTDSSKNDSYRLSLKQDVLKKYKRIFEDRLFVDYRRFKKGTNLKVFKKSDTNKFMKEVYSLITPHISESFLSRGCETGMGGGCDIYTEHVIPMTITTDRKTKRGVLQGPQSGLTHFSKLERK